MSLPIAAAALGLLFHFGAKEVRRFEHLAAADLASHLQGENKAVEVRVKLGSFRLGHLKEAQIDANGFKTPSLPLWTEPWRSKEGRIDTLVVRLRDFEIGDLPVQSLDIELKNCRWDVAYAIKEGKIRLSRSGTGTFTAVVNQQAIGSYISRRYPFVKVHRFAIDFYKVAFEGNILTPLGTADFAMAAHVELWKSQGLSLVPAYLFLGGRRIDPNQEPTFKRLLNPVIDLDRDFRLNGALTIHRLKLNKGELHLSGAVTIPVSNGTNIEIPGF